MYRLKLKIKNIDCYSRAISSCDIGNFVGIHTPLSFGIISLYSYVYINIHEYVNKTIFIITIEKKNCVVAIS